ncbi:hypothetical protein GCM10028819_20450 [Spirosoma humi]
MWDRLLELSVRYPIDLLSYLSSLIPILISVLRFNQLTKIALYIILFFAFCFVKDTYALWYVIRALNTTFIQNLETLFQSFLIGFIYYNCFDKRLSKQILAGLTLLCATLIVFTYEDIKVSVTALLSFRVLSIGLSLAYFNKILVDMRIKNVLTHTMFWFSAGLLIFAAGTFFIVLFSEYWYKDINKVPAEVFDKYWNASQILFIIFCLFSGIGLWFSKYDKENFI